jgi:large subunit ribosomal protein L10
VALKEKGNLAMTREEKTQAIQELQDVLEGASSIYFTDYKGLTVAQATDLRNKFRAAGVSYKVAKNTLIQRALDAKGLLNDQIIANLQGQTALAFGSEDPAAPARILNEFIGKNDNKPAFKLAWLDGSMFDSKQLKMLANLPTKKDIMASIVGSLQSPISGIVGVLGALPRDLVYVLDAIEKKRAEAATA